MQSKLIAQLRGCHPPDVPITEQRHRTVTFVIAKELVGDDLIVTDFPGDAARGDEDECIRAPIRRERTRQDVRGNVSPCDEVAKRRGVSTLVFELVEEDR